MIAYFKILLTCALCGHGLPASAALGAGRPTTHRGISTAPIAGDSRRADPSHPGGKVIIVSIGINKYSHVPKLNFAAADARDFADLLQKQWHIPNEDVTLLIDEQATQRNIMDALGAKLQAKAGKDDTVIIFYSGHGVSQADPESPNGYTQYMLPVDAEGTSLHVTAIPMKEVTGMFHRIKSDRVIFIGDADFGRGDPARPDDFKEEVNQDKPLAHPGDAATARVVMNGCKGSETCHEDPKLQHGVFTHYLLEGLRDAFKNTKGDVSIAPLYAYVYKKVSEQTAQRQHPTLFANQVGEIVLAPAHK